MKAVPRRLLVLGGGPVGVEMAQAVRRLGGEVVLIEGADTCFRASPHHSARPSARCYAATASNSSSASRATAARRDGDDYVLVLDDGRELRGDRLLVATGRRPRVDDIGLETVGINADGTGVPVDARLRARRAVWAIGDVTGIWQLTHVGKYQGDVVAANILGDPAKRTTTPYRASSSPTRRRHRSARPTADTAALRASREVREDRDVHPRLRREQRVPDSAQRRRTAHRRLRARPRSRRMAPAGDPRHPRTRRHSMFCATPSSPSRPSPRSTSRRSRPCTPTSRLRGSQRE